MSIVLLSFTKGLVSIKYEQESYSFKSYKSQIAVLTEKLIWTCCGYRITLSHIPIHLQWKQLD